MRTLPLPYEIIREGSLQDANDRRAFAYAKVRKWTDGSGRTDVELASNTDTDDPDLQVLYLTVPMI